MTTPTRLGLHVARRTQPYKVRPLICFFCSREFSEWSYVIHGQAVTDIDAAVRTDAVLLSDDLESDPQPTPTSVRHRAANPPRRIRTRLVLFPVLVSACPRAIQPSELRAPDAMRLAFKGDPARSASHLHGGNELGVELAVQHRRLRILLGRPAHLIHDLRSVDAGACSRAEAASPAFPLTRQHSHRTSACFAKGDHAINRSSHKHRLPIFGGTGTTAHLFSEMP